MGNFIKTSSGPPGGTRMVGVVIAKIKMLGTRAAEAREAAECAEFSVVETEARINVLL